MKLRIILAATLLGCSGASVEPPPKAPAASAEPGAPAVTRVVAIGPAVAQVVHALRPDVLVAVDDAGKELPGLGDLPSVGFSRQLSAEGVLSLNPGLVLVTDQAGPPPVLEQLRAAGVEVRTVRQERSLDGVRAMVGAVAEAVDRKPDALLERFEADCAKLPTGEDRPTAVFVYARGGGAPNVSGTGTAAHAMLELAGLQNAVTGYEGYKPLTPEAAVAAAPDWIVFTEHGLEEIGGREGVAALPGLGMTEAVKAGRVAAVDDLQLLSFGLDTCDGARLLAEATRK